MDIHAEHTSKNGEGARPVVRTATQDDIDALIRIELRAFRDVYGESVDAAIVRTIRENNEQRLELLGRWSRVLESADSGVCGVFTVCPTSLDLVAFMTTHRDMTDTETICSAYDEHGTAVYVVNLAVLQDGSSWHSAFDLFTDMLELGDQRSKERLYMHSRLPGLARWLRKSFSPEQIAGMPAAQRDALAEEYWRSTRMQRGRHRAIDPLLNMYLDIGFEPQYLVPDHWPIDRSSLGYGVLGQIQRPSLSRQAFADRHRKLWLLPGAPGAQGEPVGRA